MVTAVDPSSNPTTPRAAATILEAINEAFVSVDSCWRFTYINPPAEQLYRCSRDRLIGKTMWEAFPTALGTTFEHEYRRAMAERIEVKVLGAFPRLGAWFEVKVHPLDNGGLAFYFSDVTPQRYAQMHLASQKKAFEQAIAGAPLRSVLATLVKAMEEISVLPALASIDLADGTERFQHGAAPNLPEAFIQELETLLAANDGGPHKDALHARQPVLAENISERTEWCRFRELALGHGLKACWSAPIFSPADQPLGVFTLYYREPSRPWPREEEAAALLIETAALVIDRYRSLQ